MEETNNEHLISHEFGLVDTEGKMEKVEFSRIFRLLEPAEIKFLSNFVLNELNEIIPGQELYSLTYADSRKKIKIACDNEIYFKPFVTDGKYKESEEIGEIFIKSPFADMKSFKELGEWLTSYINSSSQDLYDKIDELEEKIEKLEKNLLASGEKQSLSSG